MPFTILYPEALYPDDSVEREVYGPEVRVVMRATTKLAELSDADCAATDGLMILRQTVQPPDYVRFKQLRAVVRMGVGYDRIDRKAAAAHNVMVCNVPDYGTTEVADHTMALVLALRRGLLLYHEAQRQKQPGWRHVETAMIQRLGEQRFGIVGMGRIGAAVARRARGFGLQVHYHNRRPVLPDLERELDATYWESLDQMLSRMDVISVNCPHTPATYHLLSARRIRLLRPDAILVNTARGEVIDEAALTAALAERAIAGAGLDVYEHEPGVPAKLLELDNVVLLPHIGSATNEGRLAMGERVIINIKSFVDGHKPPDRVFEQML